MFLYYISIEISESRVWISFCFIFVVYSTQITKILSEWMNEWNAEVGRFCRISIVLKVDAIWIGKQECILIHGCHNLLWGDERLIGISPKKYLVLKWRSLSHFLKNLNSFPQYRSANKLLWRYYWLTCIFFYQSHGYFTRS